MLSVGIQCQLAQKKTPAFQVEPARRCCDAAPVFALFEGKRGAGSEIVPGKR